MKLLVILIGWVCFCECRWANRSRDYIKCGWPDEGTNNFKDHPNFKYLDYNRCGLETALPYLWNVFLTQKDSAGKGVAYCGGSVISGRTILTSAYCVTTKDKNTLEVKIDHHLDLSSFKRSLESTQFKVVKHSDYNDVTQENDIALIILNEPLPWFVPICLPFYDELINKTLTELKIIGWGITASGFLSERLQIADLTYYPHENCTKFHDITEKQMCTFNRNKGACDGDEGDPLKALEKGQYFLYGITSYFDKPCGSTPTVYTKVTAYLDWILDNVAPYREITRDESEENLNEI